jgi:hypothetical protein
MPVDPIGSMYDIYGNIYHQYVSIYIPYMGPMGIYEIRRYGKLVENIGNLLTSHLWTLGRLG